MCVLCFVHTQWCPYSGTPYQHHPQVNELSARHNALLHKLNSEKEFLGSLPDKLQALLSAAEPLQSTMGIPLQVRGAIICRILHVACSVLNIENPVHSTTGICTASREQCKRKSAAAAPLHPLCTGTGVCRCLRNGACHRSFRISIVRVLTLFLTFHSAEQQR